MKGTFLRRVFIQAWDWVCIHPLSPASRPAAGGVPPQYALGFAPWLGALAAVAALLAGKILAALLPMRAAALLFAAAVLFFSEWRTAGRGLALLASTLDGIFAGKSPAAARAERENRFRALAGMVPLLIVLLVGAGKFAALVLAFRDGCPWFAGVALTAAFTIESYLHGERVSCAAGGAGATHTGTVILLTGGFLLLWSFAFRPLPTLAGAALAAAGSRQIVLAARRGGGRVEAADVTLAGYFGELLMLLAALVFL